MGDLARGLGASTKSASWHFLPPEDLVNGVWLTKDNRLAALAMQNHISHEMTSAQLVELLRQDDMLAHLGDVFEKNRVNGQFVCGAASIPEMWKRAMDILDVSELHRVALMCKTYARPTKAALSNASQTSGEKRAASSSRVVYDLTLDAGDDEDGDRNGGILVPSKKAKCQPASCLPASLESVAAFERQWDHVLVLKDTHPGLIDFNMHPTRYTAAINGFAYTKSESGYFRFGFSRAALEQVRELVRAAGKERTSGVRLMLSAFKIIKKKVERGLRLAAKGTYRAEQGPANHVAGTETHLATQ